MTTPTERRCVIRVRRNGWRCTCGENVSTPSPYWRDFSAEQHAFVMRGAIEVGELL